MTPTDPLAHFDSPAAIAWANAIDREDLPRLHELAAHGDPNIASGSGMTPLGYALLGERPAAFAGLLRLGARPSDSTIETALLHTSPRWTQMLLAAGIAPEGDSPCGEPWLFTPLLAGRRPQFRLLVEHGAPLDAALADGTTPLIALITLGEYEDAFWLLERGADPAAATSSGATALSRTQQASAVRPEQAVWQQRVADLLRSRGLGAILP